MKPESVDADAHVLGVLVEIQKASGLPIQMEDRRRRDPDEDLVANDL